MRRPARPPALDTTCNTLFTPWVSLGLVAVAAAVLLLWPGDVPFINDEPQLVANAVAANAAGRLAPMGLQGTFGFAYGPFPTWIYQAMLALTHDLINVSVLHILLMALVTGVALRSLARSCGLWTGFIAVPLLTPYFWFYARAIWDNTFMLPLAACASAGYAAFLARQSSAGLRLAVAAMLAIPLVHLMGLSLVIPLAAHLVLVHHRALLAHVKSLALIALAAAWAAWPYAQYLLAPRPSAPSEPRVLLGWLFPLDGARLMTSMRIDYFFGAEPVSGALFSGAAIGSSLAYGFAWAGIGVGAWQVARALRARSGWTPQLHLTVIALGTLACQSLIHGLSARFGHPHYQNGAWIATVWLAWAAADALRRSAKGRAIALGGAGAIVAANAAAVLALAVGLHRTHGTREVYGPTLANQQSVARDLSAYAPTSEIDNRVIMWQRFPHTLATLRALNASKRVDLPRVQLILDYASTDPQDGSIAVAPR